MARALTAALLGVWFLIGFTGVQSPRLANGDWRYRNEKKKGDPKDERKYQSQSVERVQSWYHQALGWVRAKLAAIHLTPAQFAIGLGVFLLLVTWTRNKGLTRWFVLAALGWLLVAFGVAAIAFGWPAFN
jgi:hypothetical protein